MTGHNIKQNKPKGLKVAKMDHMANRHNVNIHDDE